MIAHYITSEARESFRKYCFNELTYFTAPDYENDAVGVIYMAMNNYLVSINHAVFKVLSDVVNQIVATEGEVVGLLRLHSLHKKI